MSKPRTFLCKNAEDNCPYYRDSTEITIGAGENFICPMGKANCERDHLEPVAPPDPPWKRFLKRISLLAVPFICAGLVWIYVANRPPPPFAVNITSTSPPGAQVRAGESKSWTFLIDGGRSGDKPEVSA